MANNFMTTPLSQNTPYSKMDSITLNLCTNSSLQCNPLPPPATTSNLSIHNPLTTPPSKKPRGRPPGSKNKPKLTHTSLPMVAQPTENSLVIVNVAPGQDIMESITDICRQRSVHATILDASGIISNVTLRNSKYATTTLTLNGPLTLLSMNGTYLYNHPYPCLSFSISLFNSLGNLFGGTICGRVIASENVHIVLSTYKSFEFYKYAPKALEGDHKNDENNNNSRNHHSDFK